MHPLERELLHPLVATRNEPTKEGTFRVPSF